MRVSLTGYHCSSDLLRRGEVLRDGLRAEPGDGGAEGAARRRRAAGGDGGGVGGDQEEGALPPEDETGEMTCHVMIDVGCVILSSS